MDSTEKLLDFMHQYIPDLEECVKQLLQSNFEITKSNQDLILEVWAWLLDYVISLNPDIVFDYDGIKTFIDKYLTHITECTLIKPKFAIAGGMYSMKDIELLVSLHIFVRDRDGVKFSAWFEKLERNRKMLFISLSLSVIGKDKALLLLGSVNLKEP